jgi:hypothetical protein
MASWLHSRPSASSTRPLGVDSQSPKKTSVSRAAAFTALVLFALPFGYGAYLLHAQWALLYWPTADAVVISNAPQECPPDSNVNWYANPAAEFRYMVNGVAYKSARINPSLFNYQSHAAFERDFGKIKAGAAAKCWYNPRDPAEAYLINTGITAGPLILCTIGAVLLLWLAKSSSAGRASIQAN